MFDIYFGHFVDKMERGILSNKDSGVLKCLLDKMSQISVVKLTTPDKSYQQQLVRKFEHILKKRDVGEIENNVDMLSIKLSNECVDKILSVDKLEGIYG